MAGTTDSQLEVGEAVTLNGHVDRVLADWQGGVCEHCKHERADYAVQIGFGPTMRICGDCAGEGEA